MQYMAVSVKAISDGQLVIGTRACMPTLTVACSGGSESSVKSVLRSPLNVKTFVTRVG